MIPLAIVFCCLGLFVLLCKQVEDKVNAVIDYQKTQHERITSIEQHELEQDGRLDRQGKALKHLRDDVSEMGKDIGWKDDDRRTRVMKQKDPSDG